MLSFYKFIAGTMTDFLSQYKNNVALYNQARAYWSKMESFSAIILLIFIFFGIVMAFWYYQPYNNRAGRHYKPTNWLYFLLGTFVLSFLVTWGFEYLAVPPKLDGTTILQIKIAMGNAICASFLYILISWVWCQFNFPTNACRFLKF